MKKKGFLGLTSLLLLFGLTACPMGPNGNTGAEEGQSYVGTKEGHYKIDAKGNKVGETEPHSLVDFEGDSTHKPVAATCEVSGKVCQKCEVCGKVVDKEVKPLGHDWVASSDPDKAATCEKAGIQVCSRCDKTQETGKPLGHLFKSEATSVASITKEVCERTGCNSVAFVLDCTKTDSGWNASSGTSGTAYKMGARKSSEDATWNVGGVIPDGKYAIEIECKMTSSSHDGRYFYNHAIKGVDDPASGDNVDGATEAPYRYQFGINGSTNYINPDNEKTYGENEMNADEYKYIRLVSSCDISSVSTFTLHHGLIGYSLYIKNVKLVKQ